MYGNNYGKILLNLTVNSIWGCSCTLYDSSLICTVQGKASGTYHPRILMTVQATATFQQLMQLKKGQQSWMQCWLLKESLLKATHLHLWYDSFNVFNIVLVAKWAVVMLKFISSENFFFLIHIVWLWNFLLLLYTNTLIVSPNLESIIRIFLLWNCD